MLLHHNLSDLRVCLLSRTTMYQSAFLCTQEQDNKWIHCKVGYQNHHIKYKSVGCDYYVVYPSPCSISLSVSLYHVYSMHHMHFVSIRRVLVVVSIPFMY
jgi:hypothetical protein